MSHLKMAIASAAVLASGCSVNIPTIVRRASPIELELGPPRTPCEQAHFMELVPAHVEATGQHVVPAGTRAYYIYTATAEASGWAVFKGGSERPELVLPLLSGPGQEESLASHLEPMRPGLQKRQQATILALAGLGTIGLGGVLIAVAGPPPPGGEPNYPFIAGAVASWLAGTIVMYVSLAVRPSATEDAELNLLERMFVRPFDDPAEVRKAVNARNQRVRSECESGVLRPPVKAPREPR